MLGYVVDREGEEAEAERPAKRAARLGANDATALSAAALALLISPVGQSACDWPGCRSDRQRIWCQIRRWDASILSFATA
jgi:hypothetical protein